MSQAWDYKLVEVYNKPVMGMMVQWHWEEDGQKLSGSPQLVPKLKELGGQGWELVSVVTAGQPVHYYYWFKRPT